MSRRPRRPAASRGARPADAAGGIAPIYEGPEALGALLQRAGSPVPVDEVVARFERALAAREPRGPVITGLFEAEPRFAGPDEARRLYGNLFGLWDRLAAGLGPHDDAPEVVPEPPPPPPLPERGLVPGTAVPAELVELTWRHLAGAPPREAARRRDRFQNGQPELFGWLEALPLPETGGLAALDLAYEAWAMLDLAFGERLRTVEWSELTALAAEPPPLEAVQPAIAAYAAEQLDVLAAEDEAFDEPSRAQVERAVATVVAALTGALREPS